MSVKINKANIQPIPTDVYPISSGAVINYLQEQLGFCLAGSKFTKLKVINSIENRPYVIFQVVFYADDVLAKPNSSDYIDRVLSICSSDDRMAGNVYDVLKNYMYPAPEKMMQYFTNPKIMADFNDVGITEDILRYLIYNSPIRIKKSNGNNQFVTMCLRVDKILFDMVSDPSTGKIEGEYAVLAVDGNKDETIRWKIGISSKKAMHYPIEGVSIDAIFNSL